MLTVFLSYFPDAIFCYILLIIAIFQILTRSEGDETGWKWAYYGDIPENAVPCADSLMDEGKNKSIIGMLLKLVNDHN